MNTDNWYPSSFKMNTLRNDVILSRLEFIKCWCYFTGFRFHSISQFVFNILSIYLYMSELENSRVEAVLSQQVENVYNDIEILMSFGLILTPFERSLVILSRTGSDISFVRLFSFFQQVLKSKVYLVDGGFEVTGNEVIRPMKEPELVKIIGELKDAGIKNVVLSGVFSPINAEHENRVRWITDARITLSLLHATYMI